ncbi:MAG: Transcriptional regulator, TetR family protein [Myxococcaceae bacterium]|nr:Transcriptional regulator, TetR family protein [Myxococcaceae bacterium]
MEKPSHRAPSATTPFYVDDADPPAKRAILVAAMQLFTTRGLSSTSIRDIAAEAGFTNPALYRHFESKEALASHLFETSYLWIASRTAGAVREARGDRAKLRALVDVSVALVTESPEGVLYVNEHLQELWPRSQRRLVGVSLVGQVRALVRAVRGDRAYAIGDELATAAVLGTFAQCARSLYFGTLPGPPSRWREDLHLIVERIVL